MTASRTAIDVGEAGSSVTIISREDIERRQAVTIADLLRDVPGVAVSQSGGLGSRTQIRVRGSEANHVLVMIDGVEANDPAAGDEFQFEHLTTADIDRVEIVRGPQSALWGSDAVSGVINIVTRSAVGAPAASASIEGGSFGTTRLSGHVASAGARHELRLGMSYLDTDGTNISRSGDEADGYRNGTVGLTGRWEQPGPLRFDLAARHTAATTEFDAIDFIATGLPMDADLSSESAQSYLNLTAAIAPAGAWTQSLKLTYLDSDTEDFDAGLAVGSVAADKLGLYYQGTVELAGRAAGTLTVALDHEREKFLQRGTASPFGDPNQDQRTETTGYVLEYRFAPVARLHLSASARHDDNSDFDSVTTYRLTGASALGDARTRLHASYGTGQKSPTFIERFGFFADSFLGNPDLEPEKSRGWELGIDRALLGDRWSLGVTYFDEELTDEIDGFVFDSATQLFTAANRTGRSNRRGIELTATGDVTDGLRLSASYTYVDSTEPEGGGGETAEIRRPKNLAALNLSYAPSERFDLNLGVAYNGRQYDTYFPPFPQPAERVELSGYALVRLAASFRLTERLELTGRIENLLDEDHEDIVGFAAPGAAAYIGIRAR